MGLGPTRTPIWHVAAPAVALLSASCLSSDVDAFDPLDPTELHQIQLTELVEFGSDASDAEHVLSRVTGAIFLTEDEIALASDHGEILIYGQMGEFRRRLGRRGDGPGEFQFIQEIVRLDNNRILAWDPALDRVTVFAEDGRIDFTCTPPWATSKQAGVGFVGAFGDGRFVLEDRSQRGPRQSMPDGLYSDTIPYHLFDKSGELVRSIGQLVRRPRHYSAESGYQRYLFDSSILARLIGDELLVGETDSIVLVRFDSTGAARPRIALERDPRSVTEPDIEAGWRAWAERMVMQQEQMLTQASASMDNRAVAAMRARVEEALERAKSEIEPAEMLPAYKSIITSSDGTIWLEDYLHPVVELSRWVLMDSEFSPVGWIELPPNERLLAANPNRLIVLRKDQLDVESVVILRGDWSNSE